MSSAIQRAERMLLDHYMRGKQVMDIYRDLGIADIPTREWYKKRFATEEEFRVWMTYKFEYEDVSDERIANMSPTERIDFYRREKNRRKFGLWEDVPSFKKLDPQTQHTMRQANPLVGRVQVLTGSHYFLLNYLKVEDIDNKSGIVPPVYYRRDAMLFDIIESLSGYELNEWETRPWLMYFKSRGTHFSTLSYAYIINRMTIDEKFNCVSTIDSEKKITRVGQKLEGMYYRQPLWCQSMRPKRGTTPAKSLFSKMAGDKSQYGLQLHEWDTDLDRINKEKDSSIIVRIPMPTAFEMERAHMALCDEANLYNPSYCDWSTFEQKALGALIGSGNRRVGFMLAGGVSDTNNENLEHFKGRWRNPKAYDCYVLFSGRQHYQQVDSNGWTPEEIVIEREKEQRKRLQDTGDEHAYITYVTQNAIRIEDCFHIRGNRIVDAEKVNDQLREVERKISSGEIKLQRGWMRAEDNDPENTSFQPNNGGGWYIVEHPDKALQNSKYILSDYIAGSDNVDMEMSEERALNAVDGKGKASLQSMVIIKTATSEVVAMYLYRHGNPEDDYRQKLLGLCYYRCKTLPETNKVNELNYLTHKSDFLDRGYPPGYFIRYLKTTPKRFGVQNIAKTQFGINTNKNKVQLVNDYYAPYVKENLDKICIPRLLQDIADWEYVQGGKSPDSAMALVIATVHLADVTKVDEKRIAQKNRRRGSGINIPRLRYVNGKLQKG